MSDRLVFQVLEDRGAPVASRGTIVSLMYVARHVWDDQPHIREFVHRETRRKVAHAAQHEYGHPRPAPDAVTIAEVTPDDLDAAWRNYYPMFPMDPRPRDLGAVVAYWTPPLPALAESAATTTKEPHP